MIQITQYGSVTRFDLAHTLLGRGRYWTTAYLVDGLLVDSGCAHSAAELSQALDARTLDCIVNTHTHEDHIGANGLLQRLRLGLQIRAHPLALPVLADPHRTQPLHPYRKLFWGWPSPSQASPLADGEQIETSKYTFQALYTPGHSADHLCLYEAEQGWLFSGDLFVGGRDRALRAGQDIWQTVASLKRMADLPIRAAFSGQRPGATAAGPGAARQDRLLRGTRAGRPGAAPAGPGRGRDRPAAVRRADVGGAAHAGAFLAAEPGAGVFEGNTTARFLVLKVYRSSQGFEALRLTCAFQRPA